MEIDKEESSSEITNCYVEREEMITIPTGEYERLKRHDKDIQKNQCFKEKDGMIIIPRKEYDRLRRLDRDINPLLCEGIYCIFQQEHNQRKWSGSRFIIGVINDLKTLLFSPEVWVFAMVSIIYLRRIPKSDTSFITYVLLAGVFMFFRPLSKLIGRGKLNVEAKLGATAAANLSKNIAKKEEP